MYISCICTSVLPPPSSASSSFQSLTQFLLCLSFFFPSLRFPCVQVDLVRYVRYSPVSGRQTYHLPYSHPSLVFVFSVRSSFLCKSRFLRFRLLYSPAALFIFPPLGSILLHLCWTTPPHSHSHSHNCCLWEVGGSSLVLRRIRH